MVIMSDTNSKTTEVSRRKTLSIMGGLLAGSTSLVRPASSREKPATSTDPAGSDGSAETADSNALSGDIDVIRGGDDYDKEGIIPTRTLRYKELRRSDGVVSVEIAVEVPERNGCKSGCFEVSLYENISEYRYEKLETIDSPARWNDRTAYTILNIDVETAKRIDRFGVTLYE